ncbi:winged helix-turn-helix domain-containing protein [Alteromonas sp. 009811495]|uniref:winged helix-turn-helix domain-containing protein n=1 Tax=Alteromonas sp. 009811495 TaxID=3002962 RepID=UPI00237ED2AA|nr:winged helix-turn-helix domain-containing protein [Alteromonas sp. 009811495]WDT85408.1 winged helix-turn-helix domain-containing protein [Alteromonas sp. 009811495]
MKTSASKLLRINQWVINTDTGELSADQFHLSTPSEELRIDPLGVALLLLLAQNKHRLVSKDELLESLWPNTVVNEDALARCVSRVRKILGDNPRKPSIIETLPKRGYRLIAQTCRWESIESITSEDTESPVDLANDSAKATTTNSATESTASSPIRPSQSNMIKRYTLTGLLAAAIAIGIFVFLLPLQSASKHSPNQQTEHVSSLLRQADEYYHYITRADNEMALTLYQQALAAAPDSVQANAGIANALVQRAIRLVPNGNSADWKAMNLEKALLSGRLNSDEARQILLRAYQYSSNAIAIAPYDAKAHKAHGFVLSAQNKLTRALQHYEKALELNPNAWDVLINMGDVHEILGHTSDAISYFKKALNAMNLEQAGNTNHGRPWRANLGAAIGNKYFAQNNMNEAEIWYRHVLSFAPYDGPATRGLALVLAQTGRSAEAERMCTQFKEKLGSSVCISQQ